MRVKALMFAVLLAVSCGHAEPQTGPASAIETLELQRLPGGPPTPNQSFLAKRMQTAMAACLAALIHDVANTAAWAPGVWQTPFDVLYHTGSWRIDNQRFSYRRNPGADHHSLATVTFSNARWDPEHSKISYGEKRIAQDVEVANDAKTKVIRNDTNVLIQVAYAEAEELTNAFSTSVTKGITLDLTTTSETSVSGSYAGVSAEEKLTLEFGVSTSQEESQEKSQEGTTSESLSIEFDAEPHQYYLVTITKERATSYQSFTIDGVMDFDIEIYLVENRGAREGRHYPGDHVKLQGIEGLRQFIFGFDTNYPAMVGYYPGRAYARVRNGVSYILDPERRRVQISGTNQASLESNADYRVESLGGSLPDNLRHLPVEDADDINRGGNVVGHVTDIPSDAHEGAVLHIDGSWVVVNHD